MAHTPFEPFFCRAQPTRDNRSSTASFSLGRLVRAARFDPTPQRAAHTISWDQAQVAAVLQKDLAGCLCRVDANAVVGDDGGCLHILLKLLGSVLEHGVERRRLWHLEHAVWQFRIRRERDLELHLHESADKPSALACGPLSKACGGCCLSERTLAAAAGGAFGASAMMRGLARAALKLRRKLGSSACRGEKFHVWRSTASRCRHDRRFAPPPFRAPLANSFRTSEILPWNAPC